MDKHYKQCCTVVESRNNVFLLDAATDNYDECYFIADKEQIDCVREGTTRLNDNALNAIESGILSIKLYEGDELQDAQLFYEKCILEKSLTNEKDPVVQEGLKAYGLYLQNAKEDIGEDWRDSVIDQQAFLDIEVKKLKKDKSIEFINNYQPDKAYEKSTPYCLRDKSLFVGWKYIWSEKQEKMIKLPINPRNGKAADTTNFQNWASFDRACEAVDKYKLHGLGIVFNGRGLMGIDIDDCIHNGVVDDKAREIIDSIDSYTEFSPSGKGVHILCYGKLPDEFGYKRKDQLEMYDTDRFFTLTGHVFEQKFRKIPTRLEAQPRIDAVWNKYLKRERPKTIIVDTTRTVEDENLIVQLRTSKRGKNFARMYDEGLPPIDDNGLILQSCLKDKKKPNNMDNIDWSKVDLQMIGMIAFFNPPKSQCDRIFRNSKLYRPKWDEMRGGQTYGEMTIDYIYNTRAAVYSKDYAQTRAMDYKAIKKTQKTYEME